MSTVILEPKKIKSVTAFIIPHLFAMKWWDWMPWSSFSECWLSSQHFHSPPSLSSRGSWVPLPFLPFVWYHLHIWGCWYFSWESSNPTPRYWPKRARNICSHKNLSRNAPNWKQPKCPLTGEWIKQLWYIQILEYYSEWNNREKITGSHNNVDECQMPLAKWKKPEWKDYNLCGSNYMTCWKMQKLQEEISGCCELNGWDGVPNWEFEEFFGGGENWSAYW